ncbi:MAG: DUF6159 family protein [Verrucomicrobiota bacterium]
MKTKFQQSWQLFKASLTATLKYRKLLWFPLLTTMLTIIIAFFFLSVFLIPVVLHHTGYSVDQKQHWVALKDYYLPGLATQPKPGAPANGAVDTLNTVTTGHSTTTNQSWVARFPGAYLFMVAMYFISMFLATFFNVAFYSEIISALNGQGVSFRRGLRTARSRLPSILAWSLLAGVVGWAIRSIEQRLPFAARIVAGLVGAAWSVAAVFAIPVIIREEPMRNPVKILKQSALTLKRTWGEGLIGFVGFSAAGMILFGCSFLLLLMAAALALLLHSVVLIGIAASLWVLGLICLAYISSVARNVFRCALYMYASEGVVPEPYNPELLDMAWKVRKS